MKPIAVAVLTVCLLGLGIGGGYIYFLKAGSRSPIKDQSINRKAINTTITGVLSKASPGSGDYTHLVTVKDKVVGVSSYSISLDTYVGKAVSITGQYSGTTLYADVVTEVK